MTIHWAPEGMLLNYDGRRLLIGDLNPQIETRWALTRWQMFRIGWRCMVAAVVGHPQS